MAILKIARMGHPVLKRRADEVEDAGAPEIARLIADMHETLDDIGGIGLAAPQVHVSVRVMIFEVPESRLGPDAAEGDEQPRLTLINPSFEPLSDERVEGWEGCLSVPGMRGSVPRFNAIGYRGTTADGKALEREVRGFHARVFQHEFDHLDGILYPMRMTDMARLHFMTEARYHPGLYAPDDGLDDVAAEA